MTKRHIPCKHAVVEPNAKGMRIMRKDGAYLCTVEIPQPVLPASVTRYPGFRWPPARSHTVKEWCMECPMYETPEGDE